MASSPELENVQRVWDAIKGHSPVYDFLLDQADLVAASRGRVVARLTIGKKHVNSKGTIHGAVSATLTDWSGSLAIASHGLEKTGASIDLHVTYVGTAQVGDIIEVEAVATKVGRSIAFTTIKIYKVIDGEQGPMVATASHTKYMQQAKQ